MISVVRPGNGKWHRVPGTPKACTDTMKWSPITARWATFYRDPHPRTRGLCRVCFPIPLCACKEPLGVTGGICSWCECRVPDVSSALRGEDPEKRDAWGVDSSYHGDRFHSAEW